MPRSLPAGPLPARRSAPVLLITLLFLSLLPAAPSFAGANNGAQAWLTWSSSEVQTDLSSPGSSNYLYVRVDGAASFKGAEIDLTWNPEGDGETCAAHLSTQYKTSTSCTYLNRGVALPVVSEDVPGHLHLAWANTQVNTSCTSAGNIVLLEFAYDGCGDPAGCLRLNSLTLLDGDNMRDDADIVGATATVAGGSSLCPDPPEQGGGGSENVAPVLSDIPDQAVLLGATLVITPVAVDSNGDALTWSASNLPSGATFDDGTGEVRWTPQATQLGTYPGITVTVTDPFNAAATDSFSIAVGASSIPVYIDLLDSLHFGVFHAHPQYPDTASLRYLGAKWTHQTIFPLKDSLDYILAQLDSTVAGCDQSGMELVVNLSSATSNDLKASLPAGTDTAVWKERVQQIVERYDGDGSQDLTPMAHPVKYWHVEEETSFWIDTAQNYATYLGLTKRAIRSADSQARIVLMGLGSDPLWNAAYCDGYLIEEPTDGRIIPCSSPSLTRFKGLADSVIYLGKGLYNVLDVHLFETVPVIKAQIDWVEAKLLSMEYGPVVDTLPPGELSKPGIWCFEMGGPFASLAQGYTDVLHSYAVIMSISEALASGVERIAWEYTAPRSGEMFHDPEFVDIALVDSIAANDTTGIVYADLTKPGYEAYRMLSERIGDVTAVADASMRGSMRDVDAVFRMSMQTRSGGTYDIFWIDHSAPGSLTPQNDSTLVTVHRGSSLLGGVTVIRPPTERGIAAGEVSEEAISYGDSTLQFWVKPHPCIVEGLAGTVLSVGEGSILGRASLTGRPNPSRAPIHFVWDGTATKGTWLFEVFSVDGRRHLARKIPAAVSMDAVWDLCDQRGRRVAGGLYYIRATGPTAETITRKAVVLP